MYILSNNRQKIYRLPVDRNWLKKIQPLECLLCHRIYIRVHKQYSIAFIKELRKFISYIGKIDNNPIRIINRKILFKTHKDKNPSNNYN